MPLTRRHFLSSLAALAAAGALVPARGLAASVPAGLQLGYTAMTWGNDERQAMADIAQLGFTGVQFRAQVIDNFKPDQLRTLLERHRLTFTALSSGTVWLDADPQQEIARHVANARYLKECGGIYLQLLDQLKSFGRLPQPGECERLGSLLTQIGQRCTDLGVTATYHNHLNTLSESPSGLARVMAAADPRHLKFELDTAHALAGGGDPAAMVDRYGERLAFVHLKDVRDLAPGAAGAKYPFQFVELGRGRVDLPGVMAALGKAGFKGWAVVELDKVPDPGGTPMQSAQISKRYLQQLGQQF